MLHFRHLAASAVVGIALAAGGCASDKSDVPASATLMSQGMGPVTFTAPSSGTAYVYDSGDDYIVWSGPMKRGQVLNVDTGDHRIMVDNRVAADKSVIGGHRHKIYFDQSDAARLDRDRDHDRNVIVKESDGDVTIKHKAPDVVVEPRSDADVTVKSGGDRNVTVKSSDSADHDVTIKKETTTIERDR